jgi:hypothetical protein
MPAAGAHVRLRGRDGIVGRALLGTVERLGDEFVSSGAWIDVMLTDGKGHSDLLKLLGVGRRHSELLRIAAAGEQRHQRPCLLGTGDHVEVGVVALAEHVRAAVLAHRQTAEQPQREALRARSVDQAAAFVQHLVLDALA